MEGVQIKSDNLGSLNRQHIEIVRRQDDGLGAAGSTAGVEINRWGVGIDRLFRGFAAVCFFSSESQVRMRSDTGTRGIFRPDLSQNPAAIRSGR
jgi:hypothetical protein